MRKWLAIILLISIFALLVSSFRFVVTDGPSMLPAFSPGDLILCCRLYRQPQVGDLILIQREGKLIIKRVAALPGEIAWAEDPEYGINMMYSYWAGPGEAVPHGCFFVTGDNPKNSHDSRYPDFGLVEESEIWGFVLTEPRSH